ncbi:MAG: ADP-forming succinate--CoA ligase subunit beta [Myxococcota bacterium]|nr:ADP-forming succinate--CoA ligase subunit beta [Myxococcota bacterium]
MKIHEYQAKEILRKYGVPVPNGQVAQTVAEAKKIAERLISEGSSKVVVKAQIHAGGRGKGGGVKVCDDVADAEARANDILGMDLVTHQTGPEGQKVRTLLVEQGLDIENELYAGFVLDRETQKYTFMLSSEGGMDIEEVAAATPEKIQKVAVDPLNGIMAYQIRNAAFGIGLKPQLVGKMVKMAMRLYEAFIATDASILEINPLISTKQGDLLALDAKMNFDDNALYRQPAVVELRDLTEEDSKEIKAKEYGLSYIALDGSIGCLVNGAGLAMGTMDIIKHAGGSPANFLDVGGSANAETVTAAFKIILEDPNVKAILVNIFGGIMKCDVIAQGVIEAAKSIGITVPVVVRLQGTNVELGKKLLAESGLELVTADDLGDAAQKVVGLVG